MITDEVVSVMLNLMEDVSGEELFENPVILSVTSLMVGGLFLRRSRALC